MRDHFLHLYVVRTEELADRTDRGKKTIEICDLNRNKLKFSRKKLIDGFRNELFDVLMNFEFFKDSMEENKQEELLDGFFSSIFRRILEKKSPNEEYSLVGYFLEQEFDRLILEGNLFLPQQAKLISRAFNAFKSQNLQSPFPQ